MRYILLTVCSVTCASGYFPLALSRYAKLDLRRFFRHNIRAFLSRYRATRKWFCDELARNKLFHAGEFGAAREAAVRDLVDLFAGDRYNVSHGFVINASDERTTQCDVIVYDASNTLLRDEVTGFRFFVAESVVAIGEVKSTLSKSTLKDALLTLAKNKAIREPLKGRRCNRHHNGTFDPESNGFHAPFSFLLCERVDGFDGDFADWISSDVYDTNNVP